MLSENAFKEMPTLANRCSNFRFSSGIQVYFWTQRLGYSGRFMQKTANRLQRRIAHIFAYVYALARDHEHTRMDSQSTMLSRQFGQYSCSPAGAHSWLGGRRKPAELERRLDGGPGKA